MVDRISTVMGYIAMKCRVLVCDDDPGLAEDWVEAIGEVVTKDYDVLPAPGTEDVRQSAQELLHRRSAVRGEAKRPDQPCLFDGVDILVIDYDLLHIDQDNAQYTGEGLGRLSRMFSDCAVVVVLNQYPDAQFDLRLRGHLQSHADLNLDAELIGTPGLWQDPPWEGYRPWMWQTLFRAVETQRQREALIDKAFDCSIVDTLGMQVDDASRLSDTAFGLLAPTANTYEDLRKVTFRSLLTNISDGRDARAISKSNRKAAVRVASARIGKWLEREVLGGQDVLVDLPHLVQRFPFLLADKMESLEAWNQAIHCLDTFRDTLDDECLFAHGAFLSKPAIWTRRFQEVENIREMRASFDFASVPSFVFAEDRSAFVHLSDAVEFRAGFHNAFDRRFIFPDERIRYAPQRRLAFGS